MKMTLKMEQPKIFAIIPAKNEARRIGEVIRNTKKYVNDVIIIDDGSDDNTYEEAKKNDVIVLRHIVNLGKGGALKTGCEYAIRNHAEAFVLLDADAQHEPDEIPNFIRGLENHDIVLGYRKLTEDMPFILKFGNWFINKITTLLYGIHLHDTQCGFRALTKEAYKKVKWQSGDYRVESEIIAAIGKKNLKYKEIAIKTIYSDRYKGTTVLDGIKIVFNMLWWKLSR